MATTHKKQTLEQWSNMEIEDRETIFNDVIAEYPLKYQMAINNLTDRKKIAFIEYLIGFQYNEIGRIHGINGERARQLVANARYHIKNFLKHYMGD